MKLEKRGSSVAVVFGHDLCACARTIGDESAIAVMKHYENSDAIVAGLFGIADMVV